MAITQKAVREVVRTLIPELSSSDIADSSELDIASDAALVWHSRFKPMPGRWIGTADGSGMYLLPDEAVVVRHVEYPVGAAPPVYLDANTWGVQDFGTATYLYLETDPGSGNQFAVHYWGDWSLETLPSRELHKLSLLAAAWLCLRRATISASSTSPIISADTTDYSGQAKRWMELHDKFIRLYASATGLSAKRIVDSAPDPAAAIGTVRSSKLYRRVFWSDSGAVDAARVGGLE